MAYARSMAYISVAEGNAVTDLLMPDMSEFQPGASMAGIAGQNGGAAIIRAAYGQREDDVFARLRAAAHGYKFLGIYQYLRQDEDPVQQAQALRGITGPLAAHEIPMLDIEEGSGNQEARANAWLDTVDRQYGLDSRPLPARSWIYSYVYFVENQGLGPIFSSARRSWIAAYETAEPALPHTLWQCTDGQNGSHISYWQGAGRCDTDLFHGTVEQLAAVIDAPVTPPLPPHPGPYKHAANGAESLDQIAAQRHSSVGHLITLTRQHDPVTPLRYFNAYVKGGTSKIMPAGMLYWTTNP